MIKVTQPVLSLSLMALAAVLLAAFWFVGESRAGVEIPQAVWMVSSAADSGPGTLRQALSQAGAGDTITFDPATFPPASPATVFPLSELPTVTPDTPCTPILCSRVPLLARPWASCRTAPV